MSARVETLFLSYTPKSILHRSPAVRVVRVVSAWQSHWAVTASYSETRPRHFTMSSTKTLLMRRSLKLVDESLEAAPTIPEVPA